MAKKANLDTAEKLDITIRRGDSFELLFNIKDNDGSPVALETNNYTFFIQVQSITSSSGARTSAAPRKTLIAGSTVAQTKSTATPSTPAKESIFRFEGRDDLGNIKLRADAVDTAKLPSGNYLYEVQYSYDDDGFTRVRTILRGSFIVKEDIATAL